MDIKTLYIIVILLFALVGGLFLTKRGSNSNANYYMALFLFAIGVTILQNLFKELKIGYYFFGLPAGFTIGTSLYFYVKSSIQLEKIPSKEKITHYMLSVVLFIFLIIHDLMLSSEAKDALANNLHSYNDSTILRIVLFYGMMLHFSVYLIISIRLLDKYKKLLHNYSANEDDDIFSWLNNFFRITAAVGLITVLLMIFKAPRILITFCSVITVVIVAFIIIKAFMQPHVLDGFNLENLKNTNDKQKVEEENLEMILVAIKKHLTENSFFTNSNLTIQVLSHESNIPSYKISKAINSIEKISYSDFINKMRVNLSKDILVDKRKESLTIDAIASEVGFSSRVSFINSFKKFEGTTPHAFRTSRAKMIV